MKPTYLTVLLSLTSLTALAQSDLPFREIPDHPETYTAELVAARMIEGLGLRYYWATDGLTSVDLEFRPTGESRSTRETLEHIFELCQIVLTATRKEDYIRVEVSDLAFEELRKTTLENLEEIRSTLTDEGASLQDFNLTSGSGENQTTIPFWLFINGPIEDAVWHVGQVVSFRRSSGNPLKARVSFFSGKEGK